MEIKKQKQLLRKKFITQRKQLNSDDVAERSKVLVRMILNIIDLSKIEKLHCFLPIIDSNEPDIRQFIQYMAEHGAEVFTTNPRIPVRRVDTVINDYSLGDEIQFDLIIVPMLGYDPISKHRLGFGGGFYDKLLKNQPEAQIIGVCFKEFSVNNLPTEPHDQSLQKIFAV